MKRAILLLSLLVMPLLAMGQEVYSQEEFARRYINLVDRVGPAGLGVETLLNKWEAAWPDDEQQLLARFSFCFTRCREVSLVQLDRDRYLGRDPVLPLKDSLGKGRTISRTTHTTTTFTRRPTWPWTGPSH